MARKQPKPIHQLTIAQFERMFPDEDACCVYLVGRRWARWGPLPALRRGGQSSGLDNAMALAVQRMRAGDHLSLFPHRGNYFETTNKPLRDWFKGDPGLVAGHSLARKSWLHAPELIWLVKKLKVKKPDRIDWLFDSHVRIVIGGEAFDRNWKLAASQNLD